MQRGMQSPACSALFLLLVLAKASGEDATMSNVPNQEQDGIPYDAMKVRDSDRTVPPPVAWGRMITQDTWRSRYDFVVLLTINVGGRKHRCSGIVWKDKVLTAAHCARKASSMEVTTATHTSAVSDVQVHPKFARGGSCRFDFSVLTLTKPMENQQSMALKSSGNAVGSKLMLAGAGRTSQSDANPYPLPPRPVITTTYFDVVSCPRRLGVLEACTTCVASGNLSRQSSCGGDSGGPWLLWNSAESVAVVAGVNTFGYDGACGANVKKTGVAPTSLAKPWIEQVAPGHFSWTS